MDDAESRYLKLKSNALFSREKDNYHSCYSRYEDTNWCREGWRKIFWENSS